MKYRGFVVTAVIACAVGWLGRAALSEDDPSAKGPSEAEMMEMMKKLAEPGEEHARLAKTFVGEWNVHGKFYMGETPSEGDSTAKIESILGGRFLRQEVSGTMPFGPFEGRGVWGYNNGTKQFVSAWLDNWGSGIMTGTGTEDEKGKRWTFRSSYDAGPFKMESREEVTVVGPDEYTMKMYMSEGGKEQLGMELVYRRKK